MKSALAVLNYENKTAVVIAGDNIPDSDITLAEVTRDSVLVRNSDEEERRIALKKSSENQSSTRAVSNQKPQPAAAQPAVAKAASGGIDLLPIKDSQQEVLVSQDRLEHELKNFAQFLNQARVFPNFEDGQASGYIIKSITPGSIYEQLGLKNEDIIRTVNGESIDTPERAFELFKLLRNEKLVQLSISRDNQELNIDYHIN